MKSEVEVNYLFVSYVQQSIKNSASACLKRNKNILIPTFQLIH